MSDIKVSVIIPIFNREKYIGRCLRSLISQTFIKSKYEIIVINDGSTDDSQKIIKAFSGDVKIINHDKNKGLPSALNSGIKSANGKYIVRVDSDDYVNADYLKILYMFITHNLNTSHAFACDYFIVDDNENILERKNCIDFPIGCGIIFNIDNLKSIGLYNEKFLIHEEKELMQRFKRKFKIKRIELPLYRYRRHSKNMTSEEI